MNRPLLLTACLAPLLGATSTFAQAALAGACCLGLITAHQGLMAPLRPHLGGAARAWAALMLAAASATCLQLALDAWAMAQALPLAHYPAIIALQCMSIEYLLPTQHRWRTLLKGLAEVLLACLALGLGRQWLAGMGLHIAALVPGALVLLGLLLGLYNRLRPSPSPSRRQGTL
ncbi:NADH:quinone oxidoreductase [Pseudomonas fakonensis]|uniref:NADH:quinone oxidoreductase n=1 Tax=Pseudomonas fakonensis TaxID=2842355 RepID=A0ABX8NA18_9PSED|nr:NADH:quinone oxidoreductase [Pseudomonas fakonensis]QXH52665.1 NADH:quinone oxidoreductase [Pseudomonas fakonensis]